jgi:hypothetical protein
MRGLTIPFIILDISINSLEWFTANSLEANEQQKLAPWICADIAGAIMSWIICRYTEFCSF